MNAYIITKAAPNRFRVPPVLKKYGWNGIYVCDTDEQRSRLIKDFHIPRPCIHLSDVPRDAGIQGVARARDFVIKALMPLRKWSIWIDDNVSHITCLPKKFSQDRLDFNNPKCAYREAFDHEASVGDLDDYLEETIDRADKLKTIFCGFAIETNYFFRRLKWQDFGYCRTQFALYKNDGSTWFPFDTLMLEDLYKSVDVVTRYGCVVINRHVKPIKPTFESGGIGSFKERLPWLQENCAKLVENYPGLIRLQRGGKNYHIEYQLRTQNTVSKWRREHGYL